MQSNPTDSYELIDSGNGRKLERFGRMTFARPCASAVWTPRLHQTEWSKIDASFDREDGNSWTIRNKIPETWDVYVEGIGFKLNATAFGHVGMFPEQKQTWRWLKTVIDSAKHAGWNKPKVLNLFAYSGGSTLAAAKAGAEVCHLDASKGMVARARENAALNGLENAPIRWIIDDVNKFLGREIKRGNKYDGIILDPPSFGRGKTGEVFKIESDIGQLLKQCEQVMSDKALFVMMSCHTPAFTPLVLKNLLGQMMSSHDGKIHSGELILSGKANVMPVPSGTYSTWLSSKIQAGGL